MSTFVWVYKSRINGRPIDLRLARHGEIKAGEHILSSPFGTAEQAMAALSYYLAYDVDGHAIVNDSRAGKPIGWVGQVRTAFAIAPAFSIVLLVTMLISVMTLIILLVHIF